MSISITSRRPVVWLAAGGGQRPAPAGAPVFRDDQLRLWHPDPARQRYHTADHRHHLSKNELHQRSDLEIVATAGHASCPVCGGPQPTKNSPPKHRARRTRRAWSGRQSREVERAMSIKNIVVVCDRCSAWSDGTRAYGSAQVGYLGPPEAVRAVARRYGWHSAASRDVCPNCVKAGAEPAPRQE